MVYLCPGYDLLHGGTTNGLKRITYFHVFISSIQKDNPSEEKRSLEVDVK